MIGGTMSIYNVSVTIENIYTIEAENEMQAEGEVYRLADDDARMHSQWVDNVTVTDVKEVQRD